MKKFSITTALVSLLGIYGIYSLDAFAIESENNHSEIKVEKPAAEKSEATKNSADANNKATADKSETAKTDADNKTKVSTKKNEPEAKSETAGMQELHKVSDHSQHRSVKLSEKQVKNWTKNTRISVHGIIDAQYHYKDQERSFDVPVGAKFDSATAKVGGNQYDYSKDWGIETDAVANIKIENTNSRLGGINYGADLEVGLRAIPDSLYSSNGLYNRGASVFIRNNWGTLSGGYQDGAEVLMRLDASKIAAAGAASDSSWYKNVNVEGANGSLPFYLQSSLYSESLFGGAVYSVSDGSNKLYMNDNVYNNLPFRLSYYSPDFMGIKFGVSYSPYYRQDLFMSTAANSVAPPIVNFNAKITPPAPALNVLTGDLVMQAISNGSNVGVDTSAGKIGGLITVVDKNTQSAVDQILYGSNNTVSGGVEKAKIDFDAALTNLPVKVTTLESEYKSGTLAPAYDVAQINVMIDDAIAEAIEQSGTIINSRAATTVPSFIGPDYKDIISGGLAYEYDFGMGKFKVAATAEIGSAKKLKDLRAGQYSSYTIFNDLAAFNLGAEAEYNGFKIAASYANLDKSGLLRSVYTWDEASSSYVLDSTANIPEQKSSDYWTLGAGYGYKDAYLSATYFSSDKGDGNILTDFALGLQYDMALSKKTSFTPYVAWHYFTTESKTLPVPPMVDNKGNLIMAGVKFIF